MTVDLHGDDPGSALCEGERQRTEAGADLQHRRPLAHPGQPSDAPHGVGVCHEVLAERPAGAQRVVRQQSLEVRPRQGHQLMVTVATPWLRLAIWENPDGDMSTTRPALSPSRSSTVHVVRAPVPSLVTVSTVPKDSAGLAQNPGGACAYQVANPVSELPEVGAGAGAGGAVVVVVGGGGGAVVVVVVGGGGGRVVVVVGGGGGAVVVVVVGGGGGAVVVVVVVGIVERRKWTSCQGGMADVPPVPARDASVVRPALGAAAWARLGRAPCRLSTGGGAWPAVRHQRALPIPRASPECVRSSGLHPSPGTQHPRQPKGFGRGMAPE